MVDVNELYSKLDEIRAAIEQNTDADGTCHFSVVALKATLNLALQCVTELMPE